MRVAGRTECGLTDVNMNLREAVWPGHTDTQRPPVVNHTVPAFWAETGYTSLPLKRQSLVLNIPCSPHTGLQLLTPFLSAGPLSGLNLCHHSLCVFTCAWVLLCLEDASWSHPSPLTLSLSASSSERIPKPQGEGFDYYS